MKAYTDITAIVDRSGSMSSIATGMEEAFDTFLRTHRKVPSTRLTLIRFDTINRQEVDYLAVPIRDARRLYLVPRGGTPLNDALCTAIDSTGSRLSSMPSHERPDQVLFVIITDGQENASTRFTRPDVFARITRQTNDYHWNFLYLAANQDAFAEAASYGIGQGQTITWTASDQHVRGLGQTISASAMNYVTNVSGLRGMSTSFTEEDRMKSASAADRTDEKKHTPQTATKDKA